MVTLKQHYPLNLNIIQASNSKDKLRADIARLKLAFLLPLLVFITQLVFAQIKSGTTGIDATGNALSETVACNTGKTQQDKETCLNEVKKANAAKDAGKVDNAGSQFEANALSRCEVFSGDEKVTCIARMKNTGQAEGSVGGGGIIREIRTIVPVIVSPSPSSEDTPRKAAPY